MMFVAVAARDIPRHHRCIKDFLEVSESEAVTVVTGQNQLAYIVSNQSIRGQPLIGT